MQYAYVFMNIYGIYICRVGLTHARRPTGCKLYTGHICIHIQEYFYSGMYTLYADNRTIGTFKMPIDHDKTINETELVSHNRSSLIRLLRNCEQWLGKKFVFFFF